MLLIIYILFTRCRYMCSINGIKHLYPCVTAVITYGYEFDCV